MRIKQFELYREDVRDLVELTVSKMEKLLAHLHQQENPATLAIRLKEAHKWKKRPGQVKRGFMQAASCLQTSFICKQLSVDFRKKELPQKKTSLFYCVCPFETPLKSNRVSSRLPQRLEEARVDQNYSPSSATLAWVSRGSLCSLSHALAC